MDNVTALPDRFLALLRGNREPKHKIDNAEYGEMMMRMIRAWEARVIEDPAMLAQNMALAQRFSEITNVAIAVNADRYARDPRSAASMAECARILGMTVPGASQRRAKGVAIMGERIDRAGAARFAEAQRERQALTAAHEHAVAHLDDYRARRAS